MALPPSFLDELRARTPLAAVVGRRVRLARSGKNWKGCCPFHGEKTPSFYVYDDGYHCFGCGAHGDAIGFTMQAQGLGFIEAVEALAAEAGMEVPKATPAAAESERRRATLHDAMAAVEKSYIRRLFLPEGARALAYLRGRGLQDETIARFGLGWSGEGRGGLAAELARQDITPAQLHEAGMLRSDEDGNPAGELFYNRVMFPIRDRRGRVISFGGRILGDGQPKYVNGPETPLFSKRRSLYALDFAREAVRTGQPVITVEGYMDVIALHQAGFRGAVAPLGTALTDEQFTELWRLSPMPVLCFDGDAAGQRAAGRAMETALPFLTPQQSLRIITLPAGEDPDTLVKTRGAAAFASLIDTARPMADALGDTLLGTTGEKRSPEQRAALRAQLEGLAGRIADKGLAAEYRRAWLDRFYARPPPPARRAGGFDRQSYDKRKGGLPPLGPPIVPRIAPSATLAAGERGRAMLAILLRHPALLADVEEALGALDLSASLARLRDAILRWAEDAESLDSAALITHLHLSGMDSEVTHALASSPFPLPACAAPDAMPLEAASGWWHFFGLMNPGRLEVEIAAARHDFAADADDAAQRRLVALTAARDALRRGEEGEDSG